MTTKTIGSSSADYATPTLWGSYVAALSVLTEPEIGLLQNEEHNFGALNLSGGTVSASPTNYILLTAASGAKFSGNPLRYVDGARMLFDGASENMYVAWNHFRFADVALRKTTTGLGGGVGVGALSLGTGFTAHLQNIVVETVAFGLAGIDDRANADGTRENLLLIFTGTGGASTWGGIYTANNKQCYKNCGVIALNTATNLAGFRAAYTSVCLVNCYVHNWTPDYSTQTTGTNNATWLTSTSSTMPTTNAQYLLAVSEFQSLVSSSHDLRIVSAATKLLDTGTSIGTSLDIVSGTNYNNRDIGPYELPGSVTPPASWSLIPATYMFQSLNNGLSMGIK